MPQIKLSRISYAFWDLSSNLNYPVYRDLLNFDHPLNLKFSIFCLKDWSNLHYALELRNPWNVPIFDSYQEFQSTLKAIKNTNILPRASSLWQDRKNPRFYRCELLIHVSKWRLSALSLEHLHMCLTEHRCRNWSLTSKLDLF